MIPAACASNSLQLLARLYGLGIIPHGCFSFIKLEHDEGCSPLRTPSTLDCRWSPDAVLNGRTYSFKEFVSSTNLLRAQP